MVKWLITAILLLPLAEIATFVAVAWLIGLGWAFVLMLATSIVGFVVLQQGGRGRLAGFRTVVTEGGVAGIEAHAGSVLAVLGGLLLFLPGFLTDILGALLLIPWVRRTFAARIRTIVPSQNPDRKFVDLTPDEWQQVPDRELPHTTDPSDRR